MGSEGHDLRVIAGRYRLQARIGRGGMGVVWRASDQLLGRLVAVKELAPDDSLPDDDVRRRRDRTFREARAVAQLRHPHIIVVHDVVEQDERPYIVMELIDGGSLADRIAAGGPVDAVEAARIGIDLLSALRTAHAAGVLHRDIKPANVLIESGTDRVVLTDFGIAQVSGATTLTETGSFVGSPEYTAPERMSGVRTGPESDLWSVGALLCAALSGESPFRRDSLGGILHAVVAADIRPPVQAEPLLPVVRGLLERDPDRRLGAAEAERMLRTFLETGRTPDAPGTPGPGRTPGTGDFAGRTAVAASYTPTEHDVPRRSLGPPASAPEQPPVPRQSARGVLVAALLVAAVAGAGVSAAALLLNQGGHGGGTPGSTPTSTSASPTATSASPSPTVTASGAPAATPSGAPAASRTRTAPSGYRTARDPAGFSLAVPQDFTRDRQGERVFYLSEGQTFRLGVKVAKPEPGGPAAVMSRAAADGAGTNPGYHDGRVTETTHAGHPAALWEFTWDGFSAAEGPRHTYDLCWEEGGRMYDVWVSAPVGKVREAREYFDVAVDTFSVTAS
ncbi:serine/threonine protein kinase [Streptomyces griseochromogenes]|uniref:non-specific serine/threonine protein kinase n=1 Tax=Streptomyces griseochromogenes TaxID=68214 RepID=A0A1B1AQW4_9ACTN|nr:serine/threonine-protein kinase [Streptomyces griseochromogenes]ANP48954.1 serine/threonine protein kinase [Streptomyces griseochromogenes]MBP2049541.1 serine/threonine protein kinase [Streptomyces griseochromogenes]